MHDDYDGRLGVGAPANVNGTLGAGRTALCLQLAPSHQVILEQNAVLDDFHLRALEFRALTDSALDKYRPEVVVAPLFSEAFDIVDVAEALSFAGYFGELWAVGPNLPNPALIEREIREFAGHITVRIVTDPQVNVAIAGH